MKKDIRFLLIIAFIILIGVFFVINILIKNFEKEAVLVPVSVPHVFEQEKPAPDKEQKTGEIQNKQEEEPEEEAPLPSNQPLAS